ncbi:MAG: hypothetical protein CMH52_11745 [Myxococcales bacterium]|nr:hypothetical protein [Myxococcales bacterium]
MGAVGRNAVNAVTERATPVQEPAPVKEVVRRKAKLIKRVKPRYPKAALRAGIEGKIIFLLTVGVDGRVRKAKALGKKLGYGLDEAAMKAVKKFKYRPATVDGKAVVSTVRFNCIFVLEN